MVEDIDVLTQLSQFQKLRESQRKANKKYRENNPDKFRKYSKNYYEANKEKQKENMKQYYLKMKDLKKSVNEESAKIMSII